MFEFFALEQNTPFAVALTVMFGIALLEGLLTVLGFALTGLLDSLIPENDIDFSPNIDADSPSPFSKLLAWIRVGEVPILMLLIIFLTAFGLIGLALQSIMSGLFGFLLPSYIASLPVILLSLPIVRLFGGLLSRFMPKDESDAIEIDTLVGRVATITLGTASQANPAEAKVTDRYGTTHYLMVEPNNVEDQYHQGDEVLLLKRSGTIFLVTKNTNAALSGN